MDFSWLLDFSKGMVKPLAATAVVLLAVLLSYLQRLGLEGEMVYSIIRAFLQLSVIGFVLQFIFNQENTWWIILAYLFMVSIAGYTAGQRAKHVPRGKYVAGASILAGTAVTMFLLVALNVFPFTPRYIIPVAGMMVGNAMTVTGVTMKRLRDDIRTQMNLRQNTCSLKLCKIIWTIVFFAGGDSIGSWCNPASSNTSASKKGSGYCSLARARQCQNCGFNLSSWCNDWAYNGRSFPPGGHSTADSRNEHAYWRINH